MGHLVRLQMALRDESLLAEGAGEWALASVRSDMRLEVAGLLEFFETGLKRADQNFILVFRPRYFFNKICTNETQATYV